MYANVKVNISNSQKEKLKKALTAGQELSLRLSHADLIGNDVTAVIQPQLSKIQKAYEIGKGVTIKMSKTQVAHNMKVDGGFLPLLAQAIPFLTGTVLLALGVGALTSLVLEYRNS